MSYISLNNICKEYKVAIKDNGFRGTIRFLLNPKYKKIKAVNNINLGINKGEIVGIIGLNGAGKTTLMKILTGIIHPSCGDVHVASYTPFEKKDTYLKQIGFVMGQRSQLSWDISPESSFLLEKEIYDINDVVYQENLKSLSDLFAVDHLLKVPPRKMSLGERMKMEFISVLLHNPSILFLDEPTIGLDILSQNLIRNFLKEYNQKNAATIIITSHNTKDIEYLCEKIVLINNGFIVYEGRITDFHKKYQYLKKLRISYSGTIDFKRLPLKVNNISEDCTEVIYSDSIQKEVESSILTQNGITDIKYFELSLEEILINVFEENNSIS